MTSVQNPRPRLNGNKVNIIIAFIMLFSWSGCDAIRSLVVGPQPKPPTEDPRKPDLPPAMDTIDWAEPIDPLPPVSDLPAEPRVDDAIEDIIPEDPKFFATYEIAVLLPFIADGNTSPPGSIPTQRAMAFYHGMLMGLEELKNQQINLQLYVRDTRGEARSMERILQNDRDVANAHVFIGGARTDELKILADFGKSKGRLVISPFAGGSEGITNNPWYLQANPSINSISKSVFDHINRHIPNASVTLVASRTEDDRSRLKIFNDNYNALNQHGLKDTLPQYLIEAGRGIPTVNFSKYLRKDKTNVFVIPSWSSENLILAIAQELSLKSRDYDIVVFGMPQWDRFEQINFDFFELINLHIPTPTFIDVFDPKFRKFASDFNDQFGYIPDRAACLGHDLIIYTGQMLKKHGVDFRYHLEASPGNLTYTNFYFQRQVEERSGFLGMRSRQIRIFENEFVDILQFRNHKFQKAEY